jgi:3-hydroxybutyryl-CoA dehydrogenase
VIQKTAVLGAGTMGHGIAEVFAMYGYEVNLYETAENTRSTVKVAIRQELEVLAEEEFIKAEVIQPASSRITVFSDLKPGVQDRDYVIEATPEDLNLKQELFRFLDQTYSEHTILASNTSSIPLDPMVKFVSPQRKQRMMVNHGYNPAHLMPLVELSFFGTSPITLESGSRRTQS